MCQVVCTKHHTHASTLSFQLNMDIFTPTFNYVPIKQKLVRKAMRLCTPVLRTAAVAVHLFTMLPARAIATVVMLYFLFYGSLLPQFLVLLYVIHLIWDRESPHQGGRRCDWFRKSSYFSYMAQFFPMNLVQTADLPADRNYLVVSHPHGVWFLAYSLAFAVDVFQLQARKGLRTFVTTLNTNFVLPFAREYLLAAGFVSVSERSLKYLLEEPKGGNFVSVLPGGSAEAALAEPGQYHILLKSRKGFCRVALQTGASLVPTFAFGEVECFNITKADKDGLVARCQQFVKKWTGINPVFYKNPDSSLYFLSLPKRTPITIVMGAPIEVQKNATPSVEDITKLHDKYIESVRSLFEREKHKYLNNASIVNLVID